VSRSSALASKATGFPIAKIAAKLAVGYRLDELRNDITRETPACFEPTIDYVVTKVPRWAFEKFPDADPTLTTQMKSVGETMAIGRTFKESLQKALRGLETGSFGLGCYRGDKWGTPEQPDEDEIVARLYTPTAERIWYIRYAFKSGMSLEYIHERTRIDPWFLAHIRDIVALEERLRKVQDPHLREQDEDGTRELLLEAKQAGFSDRQLAFLWHMKEAEVRRLRKRWNILPSYKCVDTCAAEFEAYTPYYYSTYESPVEIVEDDKKTRWQGDKVTEEPAGHPVTSSPCHPVTLSPLHLVTLSENEARPPSGKDRIMILGGGPNRIGQGIEFDYCCCQAAFALRKAGHETIMVNSNPETVSTDYDTSDHLFFEPLTVEDVLNICDVMKPKGLIVQFGGQTPLNLATALQEAGAPIIGTSVESIDIAEDRDLFQDLVQRLKLRQPPNGTALDQQQAVYAARRIGYPVLVRPSYVLGGRAMEIVYDEGSLSRYVSRAMEVSPGKPVLIDKFLESAIEVDVDCLADGQRCLVGGVMQHIEEAGVHSGDSACVIPPHSLPAAVVEEIKRQARGLARELNVLGLMNIQFAVQRSLLRASTGTQNPALLREAIYILEVNPRASRTVPFVSKATGVPLARLATLVMVGKTLDELGVTQEVTPTHFSVKESVFPFNKFPGVDIILGPEMRSTGEVMGIDDTFPLAFAKSQMAANSALPAADAGKVFVSVAQRDKPDLAPIARDLVELGYHLVATRGTARFLAEHGITVESVPKLQEGRPNLLDLMKNREVSLVINTPSGRGARTDEGKIRASAVLNGVTCITTLAAAQAAVEACRAIRSRAWTVSALQDRFAVGK
jgi:carbamoyl-phosphate synthase large subunit